MKEGGEGSVGACELGLRRAGDRLDAGLVEPAAKVDKFEVWKGGAQEPVQFAPGFLENVGQSSRRPDAIRSVIASTQK